jgi:putative transposase
MDGRVVASNLEKLLSFEELEEEARSCGALRRKVKKLHPVRMLEAMLSTRGQREGHLSNALCYLEAHYGVQVNRSSFYQRLTEGYARFVRTVAERVLQMRVADSHPELRGRLEAFADIWAYDSTTVRLRQALARTFSSGGVHAKAGVKLHAGVSIRSGAVVRPKLTEEKQHDGKAIDLGEHCEDVLVLLDRGYSAHRLFASIEENGGLYLTRLKTSANPRITAVHQGGPRAEHACGKTLDQALEDGDLAIDGQVVDLEVALTLKGKGHEGTLTARVVGVPRTDAEGNPQTWWYLTNLPASDYEPELIAKLYVLRWQIELLWKQLKSNFCMDDIHVLNEHNVRMLIDLCILGYLLALGVLEACTTEKERRALSFGLVAILMEHITRKLACFLDETDHNKRIELALNLRQFILHCARDPNKKRTQAKSKNQLQTAKLKNVSNLLRA